MFILFHSSVESAAVFRADQRLKRTDTLGDVRHVETVLVYRVVEMLTALFLYAKPVSSLGRAESEGLQLPAVRAGA